MSEIVIPLELPPTLNYSELREFAETACRNATLLEKHDIALEMGAEEETKVPKKRAQSLCLKPMTYWKNTEGR